MGRQLFQDGPFIDPPVAPGTLPAQITPGSILPLWVGLHFTPIYANDPKAGKIYGVRAAGVCTMSVNTCTLVVTPKFNVGGTSLGASAAQVLPVMTAQPWTLEAELTFPKVGAPGNNSWAYCSGVLLMQGTIATPGAGTVITFGGLTTVTTIDVSVNSCLEINVTAGGTVGAPTMITHLAYIFSRN